MSGDIWSDDLNSTAPLVVSKCSWLYPSARRVRGSSSFPCISESTVRLPSATKRRWPAGSFASVRPPAASRAGLAELTRSSDRRPRPPTEYSVSAAPVCGDAEVPASPQSGIAMVRFLKRPAASLHDDRANSTERSHQLCRPSSNDQSASGCELPDTSDITGKVAGPAGVLGEIDHLLTILFGGSSLADEQSPGNSS